MKTLLRVTLSAVLIFLSSYCLAKNRKYIWPLEDFKQVSGTFAEFRGTHFHSGLDISTQGFTGHPVFCSRSGTISRVKVSQFGFGRALYVTHPDGTIAVYAHLQNFFPALEDEVFMRQQKKQSFALDFTPNKTYKVKQGQVIALSGNSGTYAPHLHFELRNSAQHPIDPAAALGADYETWPTTRRLVFYPLSTASRVNGSSTPLSLKPKNFGVNYKLKDSLSFSGYLGIGIDAIQLNWGNKLGVKEITLEIDKKIVWQYNFDRFSYNDYRQTGAFYDRRLYLKDKAHVLKLFCTEGAGPIFTKDKNDTRGVLTSANDSKYIRLGPGRHRVKITVTAFDGKQSKTEFKIKAVPFPGGTEEINSELSRENIKLETPDKEAVLKTGPTVRRAPGLKDFKADTIQNFAKYPQELELYDKAYIFGPKAATSKNSELIIKIPERFKEQKDKIKIYELSGTDWQYAGGDLNPENNTISLKTSYFGTFTIGLDKKEPTILIKNLPTFAHGGFVELQAQDRGSGIDISSAVLTIDSLPCFPYFNRKTKTFIWPLRRNLSVGRHKLEVRIRDKAGNNALLAKSFMITTD